jgi:hypothetical protein
MDRIAEIFRSAGWEPVVTAGAEAAVRQVESRIGTKLPRAFRQLLLFDSGMDFLREHSNDDEPIPCAELGDSLDRWETWDGGGPSGSADYDPLEDDLLVFMIENQGVCSWAIGLGEGDDPRVFIEVDARGEPDWKLMADNFTDWLTCQAEDHRLLRSASFAAQAPELDGDGLQLLRRSFQEGLATFAWPGRVNYRFSNSRSRLILWNNEGQCDWWIALAPGASIDDALEELSIFPGLADGLYAIRDDHAQALKEWKRRRAKP